MYYAAFTIAAVLSGATLPFAGQERIDDGVNARIRDEGMNRSQVMRTLHYLADVYGPRVTGPPAAASTMRGILAPFQDLGIYGASASTGRTIGGTDSTSFNNAGLPGIGFQQDPIEYNTHTHHTNLDTYERVIEDDVKKAAVIVASAIYHLSMRDEMLPRFAPADMPARPGG